MSDEENINVTLNNKLPKSADNKEEICKVITLIKKELNN